MFDDYHAVTSMITKTRNQMQKYIKEKLSELSNSKKLSNINMDLLIMVYDASGFYPTDVRR